MRIYKKNFQLYKGKSKVNIVKKIAFRYFNSAYRHVTFGEFEKSVTFYSNSIKLDSKNATAYYNRGLALVKIGKIDSAVEDFSRAILLKPQFSEAFCSRGLAYYSLGNNEKAHADYNAAIYWDKSPFAYFNRANLFYSRCEYSQAIEDYTSVIEYSNRFGYEIQLATDSFSGRGNCFYKLENFDEAFKDYSTAISRGIKSANAYNFRAAIYLKKGLNELALADYQKSLSIKESALVYNGLGIMHYDKKEFQKASEYFNQAILIDSKNSIYHQNRGNAYLKLEKYKLAIKNYTKAIKLKNKYIQWSFKGRSIAYKKIGNEELAKIDEDIFYKLALKLVNNDSEFIN